VRIVTVAHMAFVSEASGARQRPRDEGRCQLPQCHVDLLPRTQCGCHGEPAPLTRLPVCAWVCMFGAEMCT
jgi:hypothetical protein